MSKWIKESHKENRECSWKREFVTSFLLQIPSHSKRKKKTQNDKSPFLPGDTLQ